jgi:MFS family permease
MVGSCVHAIRNPVLSQSPTLTVLRDSNLCWYVTSRFISSVAMLLVRSSLQWQIFEQTGSAFHLGLIGAVQFVPVLLLSPLAGAIADAHDRKRIVLITIAGELLCGVGLLLASGDGQTPLWAMYTAIGALALCFTFESPAASALLPTLVPRDQFQSAVTVQSAVRGLGWVTGPVLTGFLIAAAGIELSYIVQIACTGLALATFAAVKRTLATTSRQPVTLQSIREGIGFVRRRPVIWSAMTLDMFAVLFASVTVLLPVFAKDILLVGPAGYGVLAVSLQAGQYLMALWLILRPPIANPGRALLLAVTIFGAATIVFGLSRDFYLSIGSLAVAGMADQISMITRHTLIQLSTPDELRGRVSSVNMVFIGASNQLGDVESGFLAAVTSATFTVLFGGVACLAVVGLVAWRVPELRAWQPPPLEDREEQKRGAQP